MELLQPTISRIIFRVTAILASYLNTYIKFPTNQRAIQENRRLFKELGYGDMELLDFRVLMEQ